MNIDERHTELIERYFRKELTTDELSEFKNLLSINKSFKEKFDWQEQFQEALKEEKNKELKSVLQGLESKRKVTQDVPVSPLKQKTGSVKSLRMILTTAAATVLLLVAGTWFINQDQSLNSELVFGDYFTAYPNELVKIERGEGDLDELQKLMLEYEKGNFEKTIQKINYIKTENQDPKLDLYEAVSLLAIGQAEESIKILSRLKQLERYPLEEAVNWYHALASLKLGEVEKSKVLFKSIWDSEQKYQRSNTKEILELLNK